MVKNQTDLTLIDMVHDYLSDRGESSMTSLLDPSWAPRYTVLATYHNRLGWQNFVEDCFLLRLSLR